MQGNQPPVERRENYIIDAETKAEIKVLMRSQTQVSTAISEMADKIGEMAVDIGAMARDNHHIAKRVTSIEGALHGQDGIEPRLRHVEARQEGNGVRWKFLLGTVGAVLTTGGGLIMAFVAVLKWFLTTGVTP